MAVDLYILVFVIRWTTKFSGCTKFRHWTRFSNILHSEKQRTGFIWCFSRVFQRKRMDRNWRESTFVEFKCVWWQWHNTLLCANNGKNGRSQLNSWFFLCLLLQKMNSISTESLRISSWLSVGNSDLISDQTSRDITFMISYERCICYVISLRGWWLKWVHILSLWCFRHLFHLMVVFLWYYIIFS